MRSGGTIERARATTPTLCGPHPDEIDTPTNFACIHSPHWQFVLCPQCIEPILVHCSFRGGDRVDLAICLNAGSVSQFREAHQPV